MIFLDKNNKEPLYMQLYHQLKHDISNGTMNEGDILAGSRGLADTLHVSRNTVNNAYNQLVAEGYIVPKPGIGYVVAQLPELKISQLMPAHKSAEVSDSAEKPDTDANIVYDLTNGSHTNDLFPRTLWRRHTLDCMEWLGRENKLSVQLDKQGEAYLRTNLLNYLQRIRGIRCKVSQLVITCGIQQSLDIVCSLLSEDNVTILMEEPGYHKATAVFRNHHLSIRPAAIDEQGIIVSKLPAAPETGKHLLYSTPSHQFPTGVTMPIGRRMELLEWAKSNQAYILEDDYDSELRYYAKPIPSLQSIDTDNRVIYLGTFSKALSPAIRMGYMILPPQLSERYQTKFRDYNSTVPILNQYVVARLIETGEYDRHIRRLNHIFRKRSERFYEEFAELKGNIKISGNGTGQYFLLEFTAPIEQTQLINQALKHGVRVYSTMQFWHERADCPPNTLFLGFSKIDVKDIPDCVNRLKSAWSEDKTVR